MNDRLRNIKVATALATTRAALLRSIDCLRLINSEVVVDTSNPYTPFCMSEMCIDELEDALNMLEELRGFEKEMRKA